MLNLPIAIDIACKTNWLGPVILLVDAQGYFQSLCQTQIILVTKYREMNRLPHFAWFYVHCSFDTVSGQTVWVVTVEKNKI